MDAVIAFLFEDRIYHIYMEEGQKVTVGSGKKDNIQIPELKTDQVTLKWKPKGVFLSSKAPYILANQVIEKDKITIINEEPLMAIYFSTDVGASEYQMKLPYNCTLRLGRTEKNHIVIRNPYVSRNHLVIRSEAGIIRVEDTGSANGIYLNGKRIEQAKLRSGDVISILSIKITLLNSALIFENVGDKLEIKELLMDSDLYDVSMAEQKGSAPIFHRSPRTQDQLPTEAIALANPPAKPQKFEKSRGMLASLLGTGAMFASSMAMGAASPAFMAARAASLVSPVASMGMQNSGNKRRKKKQEEYEKFRRERYGQYLQEQKAKIDAVAADQRNILTRENPSPEESIQVVKSINRNLWERTPDDRDFLDVRLGMGYEELCIPVKNFAGDSSFQMENDDVREMVDELIEETRIVDFIPARLKLGQYSTVGIIGKREKVVDEVKNLIINVTALHFFRDVKIVGIFDESEKHLWMPLRWLPHIWDDEKQSRFLAFSRKEAHELCERLNDMLETRRRNLPDAYYGKAPRQIPHFLFVLGSRDYVKDEIIMKNLTLNRQEMGISVLFLFNDMYSLPHECEYIVDVNGDPSAYERDKMNQRFIFTMDGRIKQSEFDDFARRMSAIRVEGFAEKAGVPDSITFLQGYQIKNVQQFNAYERWNSSKPYENLAAPIGVMSGNKTFSLDIFEKAHGPHGLVAGTTGSGKSELLQTWILSMAVNYHPYDVAFVLIDYKGGGMANMFEKLPHMVGKITNIGTNINRSLISLQSEVKRRLRIFEHYSEVCGTHINNINKYQKLFKSGKIDEPLPHLIIVADEFAELKKEEPEFMAGLVSVSRVGRSLGIHLVLATQKPSGVVDDQIWSNSRFKLCLKVQDTADSREMLKRPDAASITRAGRCYVQVGMDEIFELFQSYWSGAAYFGDGRKEQNASNLVRIVATSGMRLDTAVEKKTGFRSDTDELTAVVNYLADTAKENGIRKLQGPWLPELPEKLILSEMDIRLGFNSDGWKCRQKWLQIPVGIYDSPRTQSQGIQYIDFEKTGHLGIYGAPTTGKTSLLKTIMLSIGLNYTPLDVQIYVMDCGGWSTSIFAEMPHVGGIALDCENEKMEKLEKMMWEELENRKRIFLKHHISSLTAYRDAVSKEIPAIVLMVDNLPSLFELYPDMENLFVTLSREGASYGIYLLYTANSSSGVRYKVQQNVKNAIAFELTDKGDYPTLVGRLDGISLPKIAGRAFMKGSPPLIFQAAIYMDGKKERERSEKLQALFATMNSRWSGARPRTIPVMPQTVRAEDMSAAYTERDRIPVGVGYADISVCCADMKEQYGLIVSGTIGSGKSRYLESIIQMIHSRRPEDKIYIFDGLQGTLSRHESIVHMYGKCSQEEQTTQMLNEIVDMLNIRKRAQNKARAAEEGDFDEDAFIQNYEQICVFIDDLKEFVDTVSDENKNSMERICRLAQKLGVLVFAAGRVTDISRYNEIESLTRVLVSNQKGIAVSGSASLLTFFQNDLKYNEKNVELQAGEAYFFDNGKCRKIKPME